MARYTVTRRNEHEKSSYIDPVSMTISLTNEELQTFVNALRPNSVGTYSDSECIIQQLLDLINPPTAAKETEERIHRNIKQIARERESDSVTAWEPASSVE